MAFFALLKHHPRIRATLAVVHLLHSLTRMLDNTASVRAILIDFT